MLAITKNKYYYFVKNYIREFISSTTAVFLAWITLTYSNDQRQSFIISAIIILDSLFIVLCLRLREGDFYFIPLNDRKNK